MTIYPIGISYFCNYTLVKPFKLSAI